MQYIGEHLLPGLIGEMTVWLALFFSLLSFALYLVLHFSKDRRSGSLFLGARTAYVMHVISIAGTAAALYYIILNHYFEYSYVWQYSSRDLDFKYIISCFWAGQEGSFLVWALFQALTGIFLIIRNKTWEPSAMVVFSISQVFMTSMLLGVHVAGMQIGQNPFMLLREAVGNVAGTIFEQSNYVSLITDGNGLNPLLENFWMTIHPPILFMGYALALVPFSYAIASLLRKDYHGWFRITIPWTLASLTVLGAGILVGGAWAYVSLTFGGFWAWDPVENSSLVPWMTLAAGLHFMLIARKQNHALFLSYLFMTLSYVLVLYASYLTRSGVLADSSAHSFGANGMTGQLLVFLLTFLTISVILIGIRYRNLKQNLHDHYSSREFWLYIGSLVIVLAAFQIIFTTSIPVYNAIFGTNMAPPADPVAFYNKWQSVFMIFMAGFLALTQVLNYHHNGRRELLRKIVLPVSASVISALPFVIAGTVRSPLLIALLLLLLLGLFAVIVNFLFGTARPKNSAAFVTHLGLMIFLLGVLLTFSNSMIISANTSRYDLGDSRTNNENLMLMRQDTLYMGGYYVVYSGKSVRGNTTTYKVDFLRYRDKQFEYRFSLFPSINIHPRMGAVYNPSTRHFLNKDIYTYISFADDDPDYIVVKSIVNPYINIMWTGSVLLIGGTGFAVWRRRKIR